METWPFAEREDVLAAADRALREHGAVILGGPAGVGKSRLARELVARSAVPVVGTVRATASAQEIPLGALVDVLPRGVVESAPPDVDHVRAALDALAAVPGGLLAVDDAHLLDDASATVVHRLRARRTRLVATVRSGEPTPDAVTALWKDEDIPRIDLEPFTRPQTAAVLGAVLGGPLEARTARMLHETAGGNVLWLRHLVEGERTAGRLRSDGSAWVWSGEVELSPALRDLLDARLGTLTPSRRRVLELLAVAEPLGLGLLDGLAGGAAVEEVADRGLVTVDADGSRWEVRLAHPLYGESVRAAMSVPRSRRIRSEVSVALARTGGRRSGDGLRRAVLDLGSDRELDPGELIEASVRASGLRDLGLAERLLRAAVAAGGGFAARLGLAHLLSYSMRVAEADAVLAEALDGADDEQRHQVVFLRALSNHFQLDPPTSGWPLVAEDEARSGGHPLPVHDPLRAMFLGSAGQVDEAIAIAEGILADPGRPPQAVALAAFVLGLTRAVSGHGGEPLGPVIDRGVVASRSAIDAAVAANIVYMDLLDADLRGEPERARARLVGMRALTGPQAPTFTALAEGRAARAAGSPRAVIHALESVLPSFPGHGGGWSGWSLALIAQCHGALGDGAAARTALAAAEERRHPHIGVVGFEYDLARAWTAAAAGNLREAVEACRQGARTARDAGWSAAELLLRQTAVRFGDRDQLPDLRVLDGRLGTPRSRLALRHAEALDARDPELLLAVADELDDAGLGLEATDAAAQAVTAARPDPLRVARIARRARDLAASHDGARTPAIVETDTRVPLSAREREIALLAAEGLTNRKIAERLHVSVRTVESHVYRACQRLGLADRAALVAVARSTD